ncbi:amino acid adenylation domain-containing protein [Bosea sp. (in: a-proteobacteria)]|jgi:D-alanine--poly(phosphoribitol) ligase subunit 1|uniref:amino acid adenylation domain-containing protein n=1 Tax=Bosea sp. (in: a-proteobacteria) TaxID=1871050 RepID=UPI003566FFE1
MSPEPYVHNLGAAFQAVARLHGNRPAIRNAGATDVSYSALAAEALDIAARLQAAGLRRGSLVALQNAKSVAGYAAMLACLTLGVTYTNLDAANPAERLRRILLVCQPAMILCDAAPAPSVAAAAAELGIATVVIDALPEAAASDLALDHGVTAAETAYVMFTSGSTGTPKGVAISHASVLNFVAWARTTFVIAPTDVLAGVNPIYFDNSVFDFYASLFNGACLAPMTPVEVADARLLVSRIDEAGCTIWFSVPSLLIYLLAMKALQPASFGTIRTIIFGGEGYPKRELSRLMALYGARAQLFNVYGPTECTCICSAHEVSAADLADGQGLPTLGRIAPNFDYRLLDGDVPVAAGEAGELCLIGPQVAQGYYNDPERSAAVFTRDPVRRAVPLPMYRTGDIVREIDGQLHFVARKDNQIKHMGYRIELDEIEAAIARLDYVTQAAVVYKRVRDGFGHIVAHIAAPGGAVDEARLKEDIKAVLPVYMIPNRISVTETLPKNANGKVDRVALKDL